MPPAVGDEERLAALSFDDWYDTFERVGQNPAQEIEFSVEKTDIWSEIAGFYDQDSSLKSRWAQFVLRKKLVEAMRDVVSFAEVSEHLLITYRIPQNLVSAWVWSPISAFNIYIGNQSLNHPEIAHIFLNDEENENVFVPKDDFFSTNMEIDGWRVSCSLSLPSVATKERSQTEPCRAIEDLPEEHAQFVKDMYAAGVNEMFSRAFVIYLLVADDPSPLDSDDPDVMDRFNEELLSIYDGLAARFANDEVYTFTVTEEILPSYLLEEDQDLKNAALDRFSQFHQWALEPPTRDPIQPITPPASIPKSVPEPKSKSKPSSSSSASGLRTPSSPADDTELSQVATAQNVIQKLQDAQSKLSNSPTIKIIRIVFGTLQNAGEECQLFYSRFSESEPTGFVQKRNAFVGLSSFIQISSDGVAQDGDTSHQIWTAYKNVAELVKQSLLKFPRHTKSWESAVEDFKTLSKKIDEAFEVARPDGESGGILEKSVNEGTAEDCSTQYPTSKDRSSKRTVWPLILILSSIVTVCCFICIFIFWCCYRSSSGDSDTVPQDQKPALASADTVPEGQQPLLTHPVQSMKSKSYHSPSNNSGSSIHPASRADTSASSTDKLQPQPEVDAAANDAV